MTGFIVVTERHGVVFAVNSYADLIKGFMVSDMFFPVNVPTLNSARFEIIQQNQCIFLLGICGATIFEEIRLAGNGGTGASPVYSLMN